MIACIAMSSGMGDVGPRRGALYSCPLLSCMWALWRPARLPLPDSPRRSLLNSTTES